MFYKTSREDRRNIRGNYFKFLSTLCSRTQTLILCFPPENLFSQLNIDTSTTVRGKREKWMKSYTKIFTKHGNLHVSTYQEKRKKKERRTK